MVKQRGKNQSYPSLTEAIARGAEATLKRARQAAKSGGGRAAIGRGQIYEIAGLNSNAAASYLQACSDGDEDIALEALARSTIVALKTDDRDEALRLASELASTNPNFLVESVILGETYTSMTLLGDALFVNGRLKDATLAYGKSLESQPGDPYASGRLALLHLTAGDVASATSLRDAFSMSPRFTDLENTIDLATSGLVVPTLDANTAVSMVSGDAAGRPFVVVGTPRRATAVARDGWAER